jgi:hypothetical protein
MAYQLINIYLHSVCVFSMISIEIHCLSLSTMKIHKLDTVSSVIYLAGSGFIAAEAIKLGFFFGGGGAFL